MNPLRKLVAGDNVRATRLHTEAGEFCGLGSLPGLLPSTLTWVLAHIVSKHLAKPWWVWDAIRFTEGKLSPFDRVLEIGGGYSTLWLAQRCMKIVSIEESDDWSKWIAEESKKLGQRNVLLQIGPSYATFKALYQSGDWDVIVIDCPQDRLHILRHMLKSGQSSLPRVVIYDDTDRLENHMTLEETRGFVVHKFVGFKPQTIHACETSVLVRADADC